MEELVRDLIMIKMLASNSKKQKSYSVFPVLKKKPGNFRHRNFRNPGFAPPSLIWRLNWKLSKCSTFQFGLVIFRITQNVS